MKKIIILLSFFAFCITGCVSKAKYENAHFQMEQSGIAHSNIKQENEKLAGEVKSLEYRNSHLQSVIEAYEERIKTLEKYIKSSKNIQIKTITEIVASRQSLREKLKITELELEALREQNYGLINADEHPDGQHSNKELFQK